MLLSGESEIACTACAAIRTRWAQTSRSQVAQSVVGCASSEPILQFPADGVLDEAASGRKDEEGMGPIGSGMASVDGQWWQSGVMNRIGDLITLDDCARCDRRFFPTVKTDRRVGECTRRWNGGYR